MSIKSWPDEDKPSQKLLKIGAEMLTDAELLALFIKTGTKGRTALDIAKYVIKQYGGLEAISKATLDDLSRHPGIGLHKYILLKAALEFGRRSQTSKHQDKAPFNRSELAQKFLADQLAHLENEAFACLFLDSHLRLLHFEILFKGTINSAPVYPREIIRKALAHNAAKLILAHNHPSGNPKPSQADKDVTLIVQQAIVLFDIELVDHIIIGHGEHYSFASDGQI